MQSEKSRLLAEIPGVGKLGASAIVASMPDPSVFRSGRDFSAWLGMTPRQNSSGGKEKLGRITKQGHGYIRRLLVLGATPLLRVVGKRKGALRDFIVALLSRKPPRLVTVALPNKLARIIWAVMTTGETFRMEYSRGHSSLASAKNEVMTDTVATEGQGHPTSCHERQSSRR